jgi:anti-anti-sigma factor
MQEQSPRLRVSSEEGVTVVELTNRKILDEMNIAQLGEQLNALATRDEKPRLVLDFSEVSHMSSSALGMLITLHKRVRENDGHLRLAGIQPAIYEVFVITRLNEIFDIDASREQAVQALA